ncbi:MAG TPA: DUF1460 domain-containing protein [Draconibacterium sp.]|nr:DUF1460 domain-containing protein [Draconibacterium sp.]
MKSLLLVTLLFFSVNYLLAQHIEYQPEDKVILEKICSKLQSEKQTSTANLVELVGKEFLGTPYVANTLEKIPEHLVINLRELDCTTFGENCLAIARTIKSGDASFENYTKELQTLRYYNGIINGYPSRIHYFSDWIYENDKRGFVKRVSEQISHVPYPMDLNIMSTHPDSYKQLEGNQEFVKLIKQKEAEISLRKMFYLPKDQISKYESQLQDGDIVGLTTSVEGLDITHVGIIVHVNGQVHLMHASSKEMKVIISDQTLEDYLNGRSSVSGIMVARPL